MGRNKLKILIATGIYPPDIGGPATYSKLLKDELPVKGVDVEVLSFGGVRHLPKLIRHFLYFLRVLKRGKGVDVVYAQDPVSVGLPALLAAKILRKKFVLKVVGDYAWEQYMQRRGVAFVLPEDFQDIQVDFLSRVKRFVERYVARAAAHVIVPSNYLKGIVRKWGVDEKSITVVYNAFAPELVREVKEELRKRFGYHGNVIFSAGRLVPWKGFEVLIEVVKELPDTTLYIAGDGPERKTLERKIRELDMEGRVHLLGGVAHKELLQRIKAADVFVLNSGYEGLSHQLLEVMSFGTPIVTTDVGGNPEVIEDGKEGILVKYNDKNGIKKAIKYFLQNGEVAEYAKNAKNKLALFEKERMIDEMVHILKNV